MSQCDYVAHCSTLSSERDPREDAWVPGIRNGDEQTFSDAFLCYATPLIQYAGRIVSASSSCILSKLDQYLCTGLGVREAARRDGILTRALLPFVQSDDVAEPESMETRLLRATRQTTCAEGLVSLFPGMPPFGPVALEAAVRLLKGEIHAQATSEIWHRGSETSVTHFAAIIAASLAAAPVRLVEPEFLDRLARARAIYTAVIDATSSWAPEPLGPIDLLAQADELAHLFEQVWVILPAATMEARTLWELNLRVPAIAEVLGVSTAAVDTTLLQILTVDKVFNTLVGRDLGQQGLHDENTVLCDQLLERT